VNGKSAAWWEALAKREPYFDVLTTEGSQVASEAFFETGEEDIATLFAAIAPLLGRDVRVTSALDFGCGAGRLTLSLARRATRVTACDIAPTALDHARRNAARAGLHNVSFVETEELAGLDEAQFDFVCSLLVLQYIPPSLGHEIIRTLLRLLAPRGIAALGVTLQRRGHALRRLARSFPGRRRSLPTGAAEYDEHAVVRTIESCGAHAIGRFATRHGDVAGAVLVVQKA
jgi:2-polyprenyl-3-methyl-5-hydroxy-6-metoxy-1,4-benzoquinol methylase